MRRRRRVKAFLLPMNKCEKERRRVKAFLLPMNKCEKERRRVKAFLLLMFLKAYPPIPTLAQDSKPLTLCPLPRFHPSKPLFIPERCAWARLYTASVTCMHHHQGLYPVRVGAAWH